MTIGLHKRLADHSQVPVASTYTRITVEVVNIQRGAKVGIQL